MDEGPSYTRETANALLPEVRERLERLREASGALAEHRITARAPTNGGGTGAADWLQSSKVAAEELSWFAEAGIVLRDIAGGLLDFPGRREGREIYLCWRRGEEAVAYWHDTDTGFAGRQPL